MEKVRICIIGGGSRLWAIRFLQDLTLQDKVSAHVVLYDIDKKAALNNEAVANEIFKVNGKSNTLSVSVADTLPEGLKGTDFIIIAIEPGVTDIRKYDLGLPEEYGILQSVGDTTGPGGLMRARRALPLFFDFAREIEKYAPEASESACSWCLPPLQGFRLIPESVLLMSVRIRPLTERTPAPSGTGCRTGACNPPSRSPDAAAPGT